MTSDCAMMQWGPVFVVIWRGVTTPAAVRRLRDQVLEVIGEYPGETTVLGIVEDTAAVPNPEARRLSAAVNDELAGAGARAFAAVIPTTGFAGAWIRGVVTGLNLVARRRFPFRVFQDTFSACAWFASSTQFHWNAGAAAKAIEQFRTEYARYATYPVERVG